MKRVLVLTLVMVFGASAAFAQAGAIGVFADATGADCNVVKGSFTSVFLVHINAPCVTGSQFAAPEPSCFTGWTLLAANVNGVAVGNFRDGLAVGYGADLASPISVVELTYLPGGTSSSCCVWPVGPDPNVASGKIEVVDCDNNLLFGTGQSGTLNGDATCPCGASPTENSTWGAVKSLYQE